MAARCHPVVSVAAARTLTSTTRTDMALVPCPKSAVTFRDSGDPHLARQGVQDVDRPAHAQALPEPTRRGSPRVQDNPLSIVLCLEDLDGIAEHLQRRRHLGQRPPVRAAEPKLAVRLSIELVALLVDGPVMPATEQGGIRECGEAALCPVTDGMPLTEAQPTAREPAAAVSVVERPPERRRDGAGARSDLHDP